MTDRLNECKIPECHEPIVDRMGRWSKLCMQHKAEALERARTAMRESRLIDVPPVGSPAVTLSPEVRRVIRDDPRLPEPRPLIAPEIDLRISLPDASKFRDEAIDLRERAAKLEDIADAIEALRAAVDDLC